MDGSQVAQVGRLPKEEGYTGGYRIHRRLAKQLLEMSRQTGLSQVHCLEIALTEYFADPRHPY